jgi:hypothetical protein
MPFAGSQESKETHMATDDEPTLFSQLWAQVEPTILGDHANKTDRINARTAFLSGASAVLMIAGRANERGGGEAVMDALRDLGVDLKREAGSRWVGPRMQ